MNKSYHHTQIGYPTLAILAVWIVAFLPLLWKFGFWNLVTHGPYGVVIIVLLLFVTLTVEINDGWLVWSFGPGLIRKRVPLGDIESCEVIRTPWYFGVGIRRTPQGFWLYNVSGTASVRIKLKNGKFFGIGSDRAEELCAAIQSSVTT
jgi:hypothetical protein